MGEERRNTYFYSMQAGLFFGFFFIVSDLLSRYAIKVDGMGLFVFSMLSVALITIYLLVKISGDYNKYVFNGEASYWSILSFGAYSIFFGSMLFAAYYFIYLTINPNALIAERDFSIGIFQKILNDPSNYPQAYVELAKEQINVYTMVYENYMKETFASLALSCIGTYSVRGFFLCLITSFFITRKKKSSDEKVDKSKKES